VTGVSFDGERMIWNELPEAVGYNIHLDFVYLDTTRSGTAYTPTRSGKYSVVGFDDDGNFSPIEIIEDDIVPTTNSVAVELLSEVLPPVSGVVFDGQNIIWDSLQGAVGYNVHLDFEYLTTVETGTSFTPLESGRYYIAGFDGAGGFSPLQIIEDDIVPSSNSVDVEVDAGPLAVPENVTGTIYSKTAGEVFWDVVSFPPLVYEVSVDGVLTGTSTGSSFFIDVLVPDAINVVSLVAVNAAGEQSAPVSLKFDTVGNEYPRQASPVDNMHSPSITCSALTAEFIFKNTVLDDASIVAATGLDPEYCILKGEMNARVGPLDGKPYGLKFEMRLPSEWNGRFLYQGNGGTDGNVAAAVGNIGSTPRSALQHGFAIISSDAGHPTRSADFGIDPQARLDYGYQAVGKLTPMAKALIEAAYGRGPDSSYIGGSSNGGRHAMVAASRYPEQFDGVLAIAPGFNLPRAAVAQLWGAQQWQIVATDLSIPTDPDTGLATALVRSEREVVANSILAKCDSLDGLEDGMVQAIYACQDAFDLQQDVPVCPAERDGSCLSNDQIEVLSRVFSGATTSLGESFYSSWVYDPGISQQGWADWKFRFSVNNQRDAVAYGYIFSTPPNPPQGDTLEYALGLDIDQAVVSIFATDETYTQSAMSFMTPPDPTNLDILRDRGAKLLVLHGASDGVFSMQDTVNWYQSLDSAYAGNAEEFARLFLVPGMGHTRGGPSTDRVDALMALVDWVENGMAPDRLTATVTSGNPEVEGQGWSEDRSRPLCLYPTVAYHSEGDTDSAESFECR
ncbi:MAG: tannase/feruloyl esterase family alpha/beta hydrolase, partial [Granulosicoccus sp.]